jgi:hypothetical protein
MAAAPNCKVDPVSRGENDGSGDVGFGGSDQDCTLFAMLMDKCRVIDRWFRTAGFTAEPDQRFMLSSYPSEPGDSNFDDFRSNRSSSIRGALMRILDAGVSMEPILSSSTGLIQPKVRMQPVQENFVQTRGSDAMRFGINQLFELKLVDLNSMCHLTRESLRPVNPATTAG